jgi:hypothetical protein
MSPREGWGTLSRRDSRVRHLPAERSRKPALSEFVLDERIERGPAVVLPSRLARCGCRVKSIRNEATIS